MDETQRQVKESWLAQVLPESRGFFSDFIDRLDLMEAVTWYLGDNGNYLGISVERSWPHRGSLRVLLSDTYPHRTEPFRWSYDALRLGYNQDLKDIPTPIKRHLDMWIDDLVKDYGGTEMAGDQTRKAQWFLPRDSVRAEEIADSLEAVVRRILNIEHVGNN